MQSINNQNIDNEVSLCFSFSDVDAYIIEKSGNKYLIFALTKNNKKVLPVKYKKNFMKIRLDSCDGLSLGKVLCFSSPLLNLFFKMKTSIIHKLTYMSMNHKEYT